MRMKAWEVFILVAFCIIGCVSLQSSSASGDPNFSFEQLQSIFFNQSNTAVPNITIATVTSQTASSPIQPNQTSVINLPGLSRFIQVDSKILGSEPTVESYDYQTQPTRRSVEQPQTVSMQISNGGQYEYQNQQQYDRSFPGMIPQVRIENLEKIGSQFMGNLVTEYTVASTPNTDSAFTIQEASAPVAPIPIYNLIKFPDFYKSGQKMSKLVLPDGAQQGLPPPSSGIQDLDVGCKPLQMGDACLTPLLQATSFFYQAIKRLGIMDFICGQDTLTVLAPTNESFAQLAYELGMVAEDFLLPENQKLFLQILQLHIFMGLEISPGRIVQSSSLISTEFISWLGQFVYVKADLDKNQVYFRPPLALSPTARVIFKNSGEDIYLQQGCKVEYYYVIKNVLIPQFF